MSSAGLPSDSVLLASLRAGHAEALHGLMSRYAEDLHRYALLTTHDLELAQDVVQDVFISLWDRRTHLEINGSFASYLFRAVRNRALNVVKHERSQLRLQAMTALLYAVEAPATYNDGELRLSAEAYEATLARAIEGLSPRLREIFLLNRVQGLSYAEIADVLGLTMATVQSQMSRAVKQLQDALQREEVG